MGEVYRARDSRLGRDVAIKILSPRIAGDADAVTRFEREARALASLSHTGIAAIFDVIEHERQPALVLELIEGDTLADRLAVKPLSVAETLQVTLGWQSRLPPER
jgi:serine/threonine protein kinase